MARLGLGKAEVREARDALVAAGRHPSVDAVRIALGNTGSKTTIHRYLREIEADAGARARQAASLSEALQEMVGGLAEGVQQEADRRISAAEARLAAERQEIAAQLAQSADAQKTLADRLQGSEAALAASHAALEQTRAELNACGAIVQQMEERIAGMVVRLTEKDTTIASLEDKHRTARESLELYRAAAKEQRDQELRRHEHQVQSLQLELRRGQERMTEKDRELLRVNRENASQGERVARLEEALSLARQTQTALAAQNQESAAAIAALRPLAQEREILLARLDQATRAGEAMAARQGEVERVLASERQGRHGAELSLGAAQARLAVLEPLVARLTELRGQANSAEIDRQPVEAKLDARR